MSSKPIYVKTLVHIKTHWKEIFSTPKGSVYQSDKERCFWINFQGRLSACSVSCFNDLQKKLAQVDIKAMASNPKKEFDIEIITTYSFDRCFVLTISEVIELKDILDGAKAMLELNSILHERLYSVFS